MESSIKLIVGLGNPGLEYEDTRHNAGFWLIDALAKDYGALWSASTSFFSNIAKISTSNGQVYLQKPSTYMNLSGKAVRAISQFYKINVDEILVLHDELDLPINEIKIKKGGGHAGHNGLRDIQAQMGSPDFWRIRIGIDHPKKRGMAQGVADYVLHRPNNIERQEIDKSLDRSLNAIKFLLKMQKQDAIKALQV